MDETLLIIWFSCTDHLFSFYCNLRVCFVYSTVLLYLFCLFVLVLKFFVWFIFCLYDCLFVMLDSVCFACLLFFLASCFNLMFVWLVSVF